MKLFYCNLNNQKIWLKIMRITCTQFLLAILFAGITYAGDSNAQINLNQRIDLNLHDVHIAKILEKIEKITNAKFIYSLNVVNLKQKATVEAKDEPLSIVLNDVLVKNGIRYEVINNRIVLSSIPESGGDVAMLSSPSTVSLYKVAFEVHGKVTDDKGNPLVGVTVRIKDSENGTVTDATGNFILENVQDDAVLVVSYVGYQVLYVPVNKRESIVIMLKNSVSSLNQVVVTALGIAHQAKTLTYSTDSVKVSQLTGVRDPNNFLNSLQGKIPNALISQSSDGVGGSAQIILRGERSIAGNNNALIIVDGVPSSVSDVNPDDIASVTVLPGPSAAALYGSQAGNGVIVITTKRGATGNVSVNFNSGIVFNRPFALPKFQNIYGQGTNGVMDPTVGDSWGAKMDGQGYTNYLGKQEKYLPQPNNVKDFFDDGVSLNDFISVSGGTKKVQGYLSYTYKNTQGIIPLNQLVSHGVNLRVTNQVNKWLSTDAKITYMHQNVNRKLDGTEVANYPAMDVYEMPRSVSLADAKNYQTKDALGLPVPSPWPSTLASRYGNPYWPLNRDFVDGSTDRVFGFLKAEIKITDWLSISGMANIQKSFEKDEQKTYQGTAIWTTHYQGLAGGAYSVTNTNDISRWFNVILAGNNKIAKGLNIEYHAGSIFQDDRSDQIQNIGDGLNVANKFSLNYATTPTFNSSGTEVQTQSVFGEFTLSYRNGIFLNGSLRNDWDSRLPSPYSFQYYSGGISSVLSDLVTLPNYISFLKAYFNYAEVGNGGQFGLLTSSYNYTPGAGQGYLSRNSILPFPTLRPEIVKGIETGAQVRFLDDHLGFSFTYYKSNSFNQLLKINLPVATGFLTEYINAGNIRNNGLEFVLNASPIMRRNFEWNIGFNLSLNRNKVIKLTDSLKSFYQGSITNGAVQMVQEGGSLNNLVAWQWLKNSDGKYVVTDQGLPVFTNQVSGNTPGIIGNYAPKEILGMTNTFNYKRLSLRVLIDGQVGGTVVSETEQDLAFSGITEATAKYRSGNWNLGGVDQAGHPVSATINSQEFWQTVSGKRTGIGQFFAYNATNFRVREVSLGYLIPFHSNFFIKSAKISVDGRNLLWIYRGSSILNIPGIGRRKMWFDPNMYNDTPGIQYSAMPSTQVWGFNFQASF